jgi:hypothetical protein
MAEKTATKGLNLVQVSPQLVKAGLEELRDLLRSGTDQETEYLVSSIYMAMEYERREISKPALRPRQSTRRDG